MYTKMATRKPSNWMLIAVIAVIIFAFSQIKKEAIIDPVLYNGDMEEWCINEDPTNDYTFGFLNGGDTQCTDENSIRLNNGYNPADNRMNKIPLYWKQKFGCCMDRTTDAYSGNYAVLFDKQGTDNWYGMGMTKDGTVGYTIPAQPSMDYTISLYYKMGVPSDRQPSLNMRFYDSSGGPEIYKEWAPFTPVDEYTYWEFTVKAPANTVAMGWDIWFPPTTIVQLHIDELRIDESSTCNIGETEQCGTDLGICEFGTRQCVEGGVWGACEGGISPAQEVCGDGFDNNCNGQTDENCEVYSDAELEAKFNNIDTAFHNGQGTSDTNIPTFWAWDNALIVEGYLNMYDATGDTTYLDSVVANTDRLIAKASDYDGDGLLDWEALESPIDPILTYSRTLLPMIKFTYMVKRDHLTAYMTKADEYMAFVVDNFIPIYEDRWRTCGNMGFWEDNGRSAPNNRASGVGRIYLYLYLITGEQVYFDASLAYANKLKSTLLTRTDGPTGTPFYFWNYNNRAGCTTVGQEWVCSFECPADADNSCTNNPEGWLCSGPLEMSYGNYDIMLILDYHEAGIVFGSADVQKIVGTFNEGILVDTAEVNGVYTPVLKWNAEPNIGPVGGDGPYSFAAQSAHWPRLGQYDPSIESTFDKIIEFIVSHNEVAGSYYSAPYECVTDTRDGEERCGTRTDSIHRATPAHSMSIIGHLRVQNEELERLGYCTPSCTGRDCGSDGCGGSCGTCGTEEYCSVGQCTPIVDGQEPSETQNPIIWIIGGIAIMFMFLIVRKGGR